MGAPRPTRCFAPAAPWPVTPLLAPLLQGRSISAWIAGVAALHLALAQNGLGGLDCPIHRLTGVACPGCGLTAACLHLFHGEWSAGFACHAFAPVFLALTAMIAAGAVLPAAPRAMLVRGVANVEERTGLALWLGAALLLYWAARLAKP